MTNITRHIIPLLFLTLLSVQTAYADAFVVAKGRVQTFKVNTNGSLVYTWMIQNRDTGEETILKSESMDDSVEIHWNEQGHFDLMVIPVNVATRCWGEPSVMQVNVRDIAPFTLVYDHNITMMDQAVEGRVLTNDFVRMDEQELTTKALVIRQLETRTGQFSVTVTENPAAGTVTINNAGNYTYIPNSGFIGEDAFRYGVTMDEYPDFMVETTVQIIVLSSDNTNHPPILLNDELVLPNNQAGVTISLLANDVDQDLDALTLISSPVSGPARGSLTMNADGTITYVPEAGMAYNDEFVYRVSDGETTREATVFIEVFDPVSAAFPFAGDDLYIALFGEIAGDVSQNDYCMKDTSGELEFALSPNLDHRPQHGTITEFHADGTFNYQPEPGFRGSDQFVYRAKSDDGAIAQATVYLYVQFGMLADAGDDQQAGACSDIILDATGSLGNNLSYKWTCSTGHIAQPTSPTSEFIPDTPGRHEIILELTDEGIATQKDTLYVELFEAPKIFVDAPDQLQEGEMAYLNAAFSLGQDLTFHWTSVDGIIESGANSSLLEISTYGSYVLTVTDRFGCTAEHAINITPIRHAPTAYDDYAYTTDIDPVDIDVLLNDVDVDNDLVKSSVSIVIDPLMGNVKLNGDGTMTYTPTANQTGTDELTYMVCDATELCDEAVVVIDIKDSPFVVPEGFSPNGDGINDFFEIVGLQKYPNTKLLIYNRWQTKVWESDNYDNNWDGKSNTGPLHSNGLLPVGTYYYILKLGGSNRKLKGFVYLAY